jgi:hypothetical protein
MPCRGVATIVIAGTMRTRMWSVVQLGQSWQDKNVFPPLKLLFSKDKNSSSRGHNKASAKIGK